MHKAEASKELVLMTPFVQVRMNGEAAGSPRLACKALNTSNFSAYFGGVRTEVNNFAAPQ